MKHLLVNDALNQLGEHTFWNDLQEWFDCEFLGGPFDALADAVDAKVDAASDSPSLIIRNCSYFKPLRVSAHMPTISLIQDIFNEGPARKTQEEVIRSSRAVVFNSAFTQSKYSSHIAASKEVAGVKDVPPDVRYRVIPLPVDFGTFEPQNAMGCQQALGLPDGCVCWIGASQGAAGHVKGFDVFLRIVRTNPDISFVGVFKDAAPEIAPPNLRSFVRLPHEELVRVIGACRVGLCTSRTESQHLAGIEMGACGLPIVAPPVGVYWKRIDIPGSVISDQDGNLYAAAIRAALANAWDQHAVRSFWEKEFSKPVIRAKWEALVREVECSGQS